MALPRTQPSSTARSDSCAFGPTLIAVREPSGSSTAMWRFLIDIDLYLQITYEGAVDEPLPNRRGKAPVIHAGDESAVPFGGVMGWEHTLGLPMRERHLRPVSTRSRRGKVPLSQNAVRKRSICTLVRYTFVLFMCFSLDDTTFIVV